MTVKTDWRGELPYPKILRVPCPEHGVIEFKWAGIGDFWICDEWFAEQGCPYYVSLEQFEANPDGGDVEDIRQYDGMYIRP